MRDFLLFTNDLIWGAVMIYLLAGAGLWFMWQLRHIVLPPFHKITLGIRNKTRDSNSGITPFQALTIALAARVGSGNLNAVALALLAGGPGAIFWMWVASILGMAISFAECSLAQLYKRRDDRGYFRGGPAWYMQYGLGMYWTARLIAVALILTFGFIFNSLQANAISQVMHDAFHISPLPVAAAMAILVTLSIRRGIKGVARITTWLVPLFMLSWLIPCLGVILWNIDRIPQLLCTIVRSAFGWHEAAAGAVGYTLSQALSSGFQRGMASSEAGLGSTPNIAGAAVSIPAHPASQGIVQLTGVLIDTLMLCTISGTLVLLSDLLDKHAVTAGGYQLVYNALTMMAGPVGGAFITLMFSAFAIISIAANVIFAENNLCFLMNVRLPHRLIFRMSIVAIVIIGCFITLPAIWQIVKIMMVLLTIVNMSAVLMLAPTVKIIINDWFRQRKLGIDPVFDASHYPKLYKQLMPGIWDNREEVNDASLNTRYRS